MLKENQLLKKAFVNRSLTAYILLMND
ncbi:uncharacterized protein METZ01_LOCUS220131 [marine metagenome]|uniref:Uncharacterized protein n=1 Tax=marine metagenome TaxID=408172 RepID=A0A382FYF5_9ZZZZ